MTYSDKGLDKFYTPRSEAERLSHVVYELFGDVEYVEPSAGDGRFVEVMRGLGANIEGYDISPDSLHIKQVDFLSSNIRADFFIGNPPYGKNSSLAVKFFNKASEMCRIGIGFILPRTFEKEMFQNKLNRNMHLLCNLPLKNDKFDYGESEVRVPSVFQIWVKKDYERPYIVPKGVYFERVNKDVEGAVAVRRVGGRAGQVLKGTSYSEETTYFIVPENEEVIRLIETLYPKIKDVASKTAGVRSITLDEIRLLIDKEKQYER